MADPLKPHPQGRRSKRARRTRRTELDGIPLAPASRSNGSRRAPAAHFVRLTEALNLRLHRSAAWRGKTIAGFLRDAAEQAIVASERERRELEERRAQAAANRRPPAPKSVGMGIRERLEAEQTRAEGRRMVSSVPAPSAAPAAVIQVSCPQGPAPDQDAGPPIAWLARMVVEGVPAEDRGARLEAAARLIGSVTHDEAMRERLGDPLDAAIEALDLARKRPAMTLKDFSGLFGIPR